MESLGKVIIIGDSYSAFKGYGPDEYAVYYTEDNSLGKAGGFSVDDMWWKKLIDETGSTYLYNCSYSGSTVCYHGYNPEISKSISFIERFKYCIKEKIKDIPDTVIVLGGTNDSWANAEFGEEKYDNFSEDDLNKFAPGFCYLLGIIETNYPLARIINITNSNLKPQIADLMQKICEEKGIKNILLHDIQKVEGHPTKTGMIQIKDQIIEKL